MARDAGYRITFGGQRDAASAVARNGLAITEDPPPAFAARFLGNRCAPAVVLPIGERKVSQLLVPVKSGDDRAAQPHNLQPPEYSRTGRGSPEVATTSASTSSAIRTAYAARALAHLCGADPRPWEAG